MSNLQPPRFSSPPFQEPAQELNPELVRHYADVLRMLSERIPSVPVVSPVAGPIPSAGDPAPEVLKPPPDTSSCWESAVALLERLDRQTEPLETRGLTAILQSVPSLDRNGTPGMYTKLQEIQYPEKIPKLQGVRLEHVDLHKLKSASIRS